MALFGNDKESKEEKKLRKANELLKKYRLDNLPIEYAENVRDISLELAGTGLMEFSGLFSGMKNEDILKISYLNALIQQNWIIIKQLDEISKKLGDK